MHVSIYMYMHSLPAIKVLITTLQGQSVDAAVCVHIEILYSSLLNGSIYKCTVEISNHGCNDMKTSLI